MPEDQEDDPAQPQDEQPATRAWHNAQPGTDDSTLSTQAYNYGPSRSGDLVHIWAGDGVQEQSDFSLVNAYDHLAHGATGNRNVVWGTVIVGETPGSANSYQAVAAQGQVSAPMPVPSGFGWPAAIGYMGGALETGWDYSRINNPAGKSLFLNYGREINVAYEEDAGVGENIGLAVIDLSPGQNKAFGTGLPGRFSNIGVDVLGGGFEYAFAAGKETGDWVFDPNVTLFGAVTKAYGGPPTRPVLAGHGIDFRPVTFSSASIAVPGFSVDPLGRASAKEIVTEEAISARTAIVSEVTIERPGCYTQWPRVVISPPDAPNGRPAEVEVSAVSAVAVTSFGSTGRGYRAGDLLSVKGLEEASPPTYRVQETDALGGVTALDLAEPGRVKSFPQNPIAELEGGTGSGASIFISWERSEDNESYVPIGMLFAATGSGYASGDTVTIEGDAGDAARFEVTAVSADGGIMMPVRLVEGGLQTALADVPFRDVACSSDGTGARLELGYGVARVSVEPGSGYRAHAEPTVTPSQSNFGNALLHVAMRSETAPLVLNPGGRVHFGSTDGAWAEMQDGKLVLGFGSRKLLALDEDGNLTLRGRVVPDSEL